MATVTIATLDQNGVHYELVCEEIDPQVFDGGADTIEVPLRVQVTRPEQKKAGRK